MQFVEANGARIPAIGLGVMTLKEETCVKAVDAALRMGYRHVDTAQMYGNEREVGEGLRASGVPREDVFVTTKVLAQQAARRRFRALGRREPASGSACPCGRSSADPLAEHERAAEEKRSARCARRKRDGLTRHIGVANFTVALLEEAAKPRPSRSSPTRSRCIRSSTRPR